MSDSPTQVAVFGGSGFFGGYLIDELLVAGYRPSLLVRPGSEHKVRNAERCRLTTGSIDSEAAIAATLDGCSATIYCIGILRENPGQGITFKALQHDGAVRVADMAARNGVRRFLLMSASGVRPSGTAYQETKYRAELDVRARPLDVTVFRPSVIFGAPRGTMEIATQLYRDMVSPPLPAVSFMRGFLPSSGPVLLSPVYVKDVATAFVNALDSEHTIGMTYELGGPETLSWRQIVERIAAAASRRKIIFPMPIPMMKAAAFFLDWLPFFPVTRDQLTMLVEGTRIDPGPLAELINRPPTSFDADSLSYLLELS